MYVVHLRMNGICSYKTGFQFDLGHISRFPQIVVMCQRRSLEEVLLEKLMCEVWKTQFHGIFQRYNAVVQIKKRGWGGGQEKVIVLL